MAGPLSFAQEQALISLHRGCHFGIDPRTRRGLLTRDLVSLGYFNEWFPEMPFLTEAGRPIAARLAAKQELCAGVRRLANGFGVIDGGLNG